MRVRVLYHDHCFDGAASAAFFSRFIGVPSIPTRSFVYTGMAHRASQIFEDSLFDGDENAIVDFKYSTNPKLTWWFDHHQSAFLTPEDAEHFRQRQQRQEAVRPSVQVLHELHLARGTGKWGYERRISRIWCTGPNIIDGAQYPDAKTAVELGAPAMKLTLVIEGSKGSDIVQRIIRCMQHMPLDEIIAAAGHPGAVRAALRPASAIHRHYSRARGSESTASSSSI